MADKKPVVVVKHSVSNIDRRSEKAQDIEVISKKTRITSSDTSSSFKRSRGTFGRLASRFVSRVSNFDTGMSFVKFIFLVLFVLAISSYIFGNEMGLSFSALLDRLAGAESSSFNLTAYFYVLRDVMRITSDWGLFNFVRDFLNVILGAVGFLIQALGGILDIIIFLYDLFFVNFV